MPVHAIWAVDPQDANESIFSNASLVLKSLSRSFQMSIEPVFVLTPLPMMDLDIPDVEKMMNQWRANAELLLKQRLKKIKIPLLREGQVLVEKQPSIKNAALSLIKLATRNKTDFIIVGTHARKGMARFFLGSFAETLMLLSPVPLIVVPPDARLNSSVKHILFPTDFSTSSEDVFKHLLPYAKKMGAKITLFHHLQNIAEQIIQSGVTIAGGGWINTDLVFEEQKARVQKEAERWTQIASLSDVRAESKIVAGMLSTAAIIEKTASKVEADLIAMSSQSGTVSSVMLGSIARQTMRSSKLPVWILHASNNLRTKDDDLDDKIKYEKIPEHLQNLG